MKRRYKWRGLLYRCEPSLYGFLRTIKKKCIPVNEIICARSPERGSISMRNCAGGPWTTSPHTAPDCWYHHSWTWPEWGGKEERAWISRNQQNPGHQKDKIIAFKMFIWTLQFQYQMPSSVTARSKIEHPSFCFLLPHIPSWVEGCTNVWWFLNSTSVILSELN